MRQDINLNNDWEFVSEFSEPFLKGEGVAACETVRLPHTCKETPYNYFSEEIYQMVCGYRRLLDVPAEWEGQSVALHIGAAGHYAQVYLNGTLLAEHRNGYTAFRVDLTNALRYGQSNLLVIRVDSRESLNQPPFGLVIDYMTYGGLYREVRLEVREQAHFEDAFLMPQTDVENCQGTLQSEYKIANPEGKDLYLRQTVLDAKGTVCARGTLAVKENTCRPQLTVGEVALWSCREPNLYTVRSELLQDDKVLDSREDRIGFRTAVFRTDGFYLNGEKLLIRGLNRHQSYPYVGYAMPASMQRMDAEILKYELGLNAVRTSHYPQSVHFLNRCDELGLLVFTEIPGWQHLGDDAWKQQAIQNVEEMVVQYRNHPSIVLWGVRINESMDDDALYTETNRAAHRLDPTRQTGGVRYLKKSHLLEDVYTYNDFVHNGKNQGVDPKRAVTSDTGKGYLVSEYNGHMYPTKLFDSEEHLTSHALRHATVLNDIAKEKDIAGGFGWCMFDYNTHKDFGSGDRICYHGVMDMYRNPKLAAAVYAAQGSEETVLEISAQMDIGEHPGGNMGKVYLITNADSVRMYKNGRLLKEYTAKDSGFKHLAHGPILIDDYVGPGLQEAEGFTPTQARLVGEILNYSAIHGFNQLPPRIMAKAARVMAQYRMTFAQAYQLYGKYVGSWGDTATSYRFEAVKDGEVVKVVEKTPPKALSLDIKVDHTDLVEGDTYDVAAVRVTLRDEHGNHLRFFNGPVELSVRGPVELIGPSILSLRGGCGGTYLRTLGTAGDAVLTLKSDQAEPVTVAFTVTV